MGHSTRTPRTRLVTCSLLFYAACLAGQFACAPPPPTIVTPEGKVAYTALEIAKRVGNLQDATIAANTSGGLADRFAIPIVEYTNSALRILRETPDGWRETVVTGYQELLKRLPPSLVEEYRVYFQAISIALNLHFSPAVTVPHA